MVHRGYVGVMFPYSKFNTSSKNILGGFRLHGLASHGQNNQEKPWRISLLGAPALVPNGDLLDLLWRLTSAHSFPVRKVKAHCTDDSQPAIDTPFNNSADVAAKAANRRSFAHPAWVRAIRQAEILSMWKFIAAARRAYLKALPAKQAAPDVVEDSAEVPSPFGLHVLLGGSGYELSGVAKSTFMTSGVSPALKVSDGLYAVFLCKFWSLVRWHPAHKDQSESFTSWLELMLSFEMLTERPVPVAVSNGHVWAPEAWIHEPPAWKRVRVFQAGVHQLSKLFKKELYPASASVPWTFYGCHVQRQPRASVFVASTLTARLYVGFFSLHPCQ